jgi:HSP20 family protein
MANLRVFNPIENDPFDQLLKGFFRPARVELDERVPKIKLEVEEDEKAYTVRADIPGAKKEDIDVNIDGNVVSITAEIKREQDIKEKGKVLHSERFYGSASRSFTLAHDVDEGKSQANYEGGVLKLTLPKKANGSAKRLSVS